jgi:hypothetical protein
MKIGKICARLVYIIPSEIDSYRCESQEFLLCYVFSGLPWRLTPYGNIAALCLPVVGRRYAILRKMLFFSKKFTNCKE